VHMSKRKQEQSEAQKIIAEFEQHPVWKASEDLRVNLLGIKKDLHEQLHAAARALVEANPDVDPEWLKQTLTDIAMPPLVRAAQTACCRNNLPHEAFLQDIFWQRLFDVAFSVAECATECALQEQEDAAPAVSGAQVLEIVKPKEQVK
jgi:hypothetical protein